MLRKFVSFIVFLGVFSAPFAGATVVVPQSAEERATLERADYEAGVQAWIKFRGDQAKPCNFAYDSKEILRGKKAFATVILLHGYSQNPEKMDDYFEFFKQYDVNVLAPRLDKHFNSDIKDLNRSSYVGWLKQTTEAVRIAKLLGRRVVIVGYSLGGLLASRMALDFPNDIFALVLLSPAWRVNGGVSLGLALYKGESVNGHMGVGEAKCESASPYISTAGGDEVQELSKDTERVHKGAYPRVDGSAYRAMDTPTLLAIAEQDQIVDAVTAIDMFGSSESGYRTLLVYRGTDHSLLTTPGMPGTQHFLKTWSRTPFEGETVLEQIKEFLAAHVGMKVKVQPALD